MRVHEIIGEEHLRTISAVAGLRRSMGESLADEHGTGQAFASFRELRDRSGENTALVGAYTVLDSMGIRDFTTMNNRSQLAVCYLACLHRSLPARARELEASLDVRDRIAVNMYINNVGQATSDHIQRHRDTISFISTVVSPLVAATGPVGTLVGASTTAFSASLDSFLGERQRSIQGFSMEQLQTLVPAVRNAGNYSLFEKHSLLSQLLAPHGQALSYSDPCRNIICDGLRQVQMDILHEQSALLQAQGVRVEQQGATLQTFFNMYTKDRETLFTWMRQERNRSVAAAQLQAREAEFSAKVGLVQNFGNFIGEFCAVTGNPRLGRQFATCSGATAQIMKSVRSVQKLSGTAVSMTSMIATFSAVLSIGGAFMSVLGSFFGDSDDGIAEALQMISQQIRELHNFVAEFRQEMHTRFDHLELLIRNSFSSMGRILLYYQQQTAYLLEQIERGVNHTAISVQLLHHGLADLGSFIRDNQALPGLRSFANDIRGLCEAERQSISPELYATKLAEIVNKLRFLSDETMIGYTSSGGEVDFKRLVTSSPQGLIGHLVRKARASVNVVNPFLYKQLVDLYVDLRIKFKGKPNMGGRSEVSVLNEISGYGTISKDFIYALRRNVNLFNELICNAIARLNQLRQKIKNLEATYLEEKIRVQNLRRFDRLISEVEAMPDTIEKVPVVYEKPNTIYHLGIGTPPTRKVTVRIMWTMNVSCVKTKEYYLCELRRMQQQFRLHFDSLFFDPEFFSHQFSELSVPFLSFPRGDAQSIVYAMVPLLFPEISLKFSGARMDQNNIHVLYLLAQELCGADQEPRELRYFYRNKHVDRTKVTGVGEVVVITDIKAFPALWGGRSFSSPLDYYTNPVPDAKTSYYTNTVPGTEIEVEFTGLGKIAHKTRENPPSPPNLHALIARIPWINSLSIPRGVEKEVVHRDALLTSLPHVQGEQLVYRETLPVAEMNAKLALVRDLVTSKLKEHRKAFAKELIREISRGSSMPHDLCGILNDLATAVQWLNSFLKLIFPVATAEEQIYQLLNWQNWPLSHVNWESRSWRSNLLHYLDIYQGEQDFVYEQISSLIRYFCTLGDHLLGAAFQPQAVAELRGIAEITELQRSPNATPPIRATRTEAEDIAETQVLQRTLDSIDALRLLIPELNADDSHIERPAPQQATPSQQDSDLRDEVRQLREQLAQQNELILQLLRQQATFQPGQASASSGPGFFASASGQPGQGAQQSPPSPQAH